ncbi:MAG: DMT family transporter [Actinomycetia bacterium]|nr:DMT family transporter [Actinomycetes bacterium]MCP4087441.1 DMT family transporter [Actinomycetes bacterium]
MAILAISSSAVLVSWIGASALALSFWRTWGGAVLLAPAAWASGERPSRSTWVLLLASGGALAIHFSTWLASLRMTSVAASVTLVSTAPAFVAVYRHLTGIRVPPRQWMAIGLALIGVVVITAGDAGAVGDSFDGEALRGDGWALVGGVAMAAYLLLGERLRQELSTPAYAARTYGVAAGALLITALASGVDLVGYDGRTWLAIGAMVVGPQLAGHTVLNHLLARVGSVTVSLSLLAEPVGAALLTGLVFAEVPPLAVWLGAPLVLAGLALVISQGRGDT